MARTLTTLASVPYVYSMQKCYSTQTFTDGVQRGNSARANVGLCVTPPVTQQSKAEEEVHPDLRPCSHTEGCFPPSSRLLSCEPNVSDAAAVLPQLIHSLLIDVKLLLHSAKVIS